jgi:cytochrome c biogenesis protein ResB
MENSTINKRRSKVCNTHINKLIYAPKGAFMKMGNVII